MEQCLLKDYFQRLLNRIKKYFLKFKNLTTHKHQICRESQQALITYIFFHLF